MRRVNSLWWCVILMLGMSGLAAWGAADSLLGMPAPDFALRAYAGGNVRLSEHRGEVVVLSFWGSRCGPCAAQLAALDRSYRTYRSAGLAVFGIAVDDDPRRAREFAEGRGVAFPMLADADKSVSRSYDVDVLPTTLLIDRSGAIRHVHRDFDRRSEALYLQQLRALLNE